MTDEEIVHYFREVCDFQAQAGRPLVMDLVFREVLRRAGVDSSSLSA